LSRSLLALLLLASCATPYEPFEGRPVLAALKFEGNGNISSGDLLSHIATAPTTGFFSKTPRYYDADLFALDVKRIERLYNQRGFYQAKVKDVQEVRDDKGRVTLVVKIDEGRRAYVRKMDFEGVDDLPRDEVNDLDDSLPIHPGDEFNEEVYDKAKDVLLQQLREHGFAQARVRGRVEVAPEEGVAHIVFEVDHGPRYQFGRVNVSGNRRIPAEPIAEATGIHRGDRYDPKALALAQQRVYNLGTFSGVRVGIEPLGDTPVAAVRVNVREAPFQTIRLGLGGSAESTRWELPRLRVEYINRSLFGGLRRLELSSTIGYAFVPSPFPGQYSASESGVTNTTSAQLTIPSIFLPGFDWISRAEFAREVQNGYSYDDVAARTGLLYRRGSHSISGSLNYVRYFHGTLRGVTAQNAANAVSLQGCIPACTLTYPEVRYVFDGRDNAIEPSQGAFLSMGLQQTLKPGSFSYFRINPDVRGYAPLGRFAVLAMRAEYGGLFSDISSTPFQQRFFLGGQNDQRGYSGQRQGPKVGYSPCGSSSPGCREPFATSSTPVGGTSAVLLSAELRIHADALLNHLGIVPFVDASSVADTPRRPFAGGLEVAAGLGLRYLTAFGPLRLDFGWLVNPAEVITVPLTNPPAPGGTVATPVTVHCHDASCISESRWAIHVSLGEAF
jgi:translocation and assembly module TamA